MKNQLIQKALSLFESKGFVETSIQDIVDACGVTKGSFYYYFKSKGQLLKNIQLDYINELLSAQEKIIENKKGNQTKLKQMIALLITKIKTDGASARIFFREMRHLPQSDLDEIVTKRDKIRYNIKNVIQSGIETDEFSSSIDSDLVTFAILGMCNWSYSWYDPAGNLNEDDVIEGYLNLVLHGINRPSSYN